MVIPNYEAIDNSGAEPITGDVTEINYAYETIEYRSEDNGIISVPFADCVLRAIEKRNIRLQSWLYKPAIDGEVTDNVIGYFTRPDFFNVTKLADWTHGEGRLIFDGKDECSSSTTRGEANGPRTLPSNQVVLKHPERWDAWETLITRNEAIILKNYWLRRTEAKPKIKYDYFGVCTSVRLLRHLQLRNYKKTYCTIYLADGFWEIGKFERCVKISPQKYGEKMDSDEEPYNTWKRVDPMKQKYEGVV